MKEDHNIRVTIYEHDKFPEYTIEPFQDGARRNFYGMYSMDISEELYLQFTEAKKTYDAAEREIRRLIERTERLIEQTR